MTARGQVKNAVIVLEQGVRFPEGQSVIVKPSDAHEDSTLASPTRRHSLLDIPPVSLGEILPATSSDDDLLDEMLADRT